MYASLTCCPAFLLAFTALLCTTTVSAVETEIKPASHKLAVDESRTVRVVARETFNRSGLKVSPGQHYSFVVAENSEWKDLTIVCDANGWLSKDAASIARSFLKKPEKGRRVPAANWFELIGTVGADEDHHFQIGLRGKEWTWTAEADGDLYLFANDLINMYRNNHGSIEVTITRRASPGEYRLPVSSKQRDKTTQ